MLSALSTNERNVRQSNDQAVATSIVVLSSFIIAILLGVAFFYNAWLFLGVILVIPFLNQGLYFLFGTPGLIGRESQLSTNRYYLIFEISLIKTGDGNTREVIIYLDEKGRMRTVTLEANSQFKIMRFGHKEFLIPSGTDLIEKEGLLVLRRFET